VGEGGQHNKETVKTKLRILSIKYLKFLFLSP
jgi:hypothetical protein